MDASQEEQNLFSQIQSYSYYIHLVEASGLPYDTYAMVFMEENGFLETIGNMTAMINHKTVPYVWTTGQLLPWEKSADDAATLLQQNIESLGGTFSKVIVQQPWNYFPFVSTQALQQGFYPKLEALQGTRGTYYIGGLMNYETVEQTTDYARDLVQRFFQ